MGKKVEITILEYEHKYVIKSKYVGLELFKPIELKDVKKRAKELIENYFNDKKKDMPTSEEKYEITIKE